MYSRIQNLIFWQNCGREVPAGCLRRLHSCC